MIGIPWFHEAANQLRALFSAMVLVGAVGLHLTTGSH
jgi:multidrug transporter EmrE-like cation transporter